MANFFWYKTTGDGSADVYEDTPEIQARVDTEWGWFASPEGAILFGGVEAVAFSINGATLTISATPEMRKAIHWRTEYVERASDRER